MTIKKLHSDFKHAIVILYCVVVFKRCISFYTKVFTFDNGKNKYKCSLERTQDNVVYVKLWLVMPLGSNAKQSKVKPCV